MWAYVSTMHRGIAQRKIMFLGRRFCGRIMKSACVTSMTSMTSMNIEQTLKVIAIWTCFSTYRSKFHHAYALSGWQERYKRPRNSGKHIEGQPCGSWPFLPICWIRPSVEMCHGWKDKKNKISNLTNLAMISWLRFIVTVYIICFLKGLSMLVIDERTPLAEDSCFVVKERVDDFFCQVQAIQIQTKWLEGSHYLAMLCGFFLMHLGTIGDWFEIQCSKFCQHLEAQFLYGLLVEVLIFVIVYVGGGPGGENRSVRLCSKMLQRSSEFGTPKKQHLSKHVQ